MFCSIFGLYGVCSAMAIRSVCTAPDAFLEALKSTPRDSAQGALGSRLAGRPAGQRAQDQRALRGPADSAVTLM